MKNLPITVVLLYKYCSVINLTLKKQRKGDFGMSALFLFLKMEVLALPETLRVWHSGSRNASQARPSCLDCVPGTRPCIILTPCASQFSPLAPVLQQMGLGDTYAHRGLQEVRVVVPQVESYANFWEKRVHADGSRPYKVCSAFRELSVRSSPTVVQMKNLKPRSLKGLCPGSHRWW